MVLTGYLGRPDSFAACPLSPGRTFSSSLADQPGRVWAAHHWPGLLPALPPRPHRLVCDPDRIGDGPDTALPYL
jgi:hypothetical protein